MTERYCSKIDSLIISIEGSRAVGKTTLLTGLQELFPSAFIRKGFERSSKKFNMETEKGFLSCEKWYIEREIKTVKKLRNQQLSLIARGPESIEFHCLNFPRLKCKDWNISTLLDKELTLLRKQRSDKILYLSASITTLKKRAQLDKKTRFGLDEWFDIWYPEMESFFLSLPHVHILNTDSLNPENVINIVADWIRNQMYCDKTIKKSR